METERKLLLKLEKELTIYSTSQLATMMGYRSPNTVQNWIKTKKIPASARLRIKDYFNKKGKEK